MQDAELRGIVLRDFYSLRNTIAPVRVSDILILLNGNDENRIAGVCRELSRYRLIDWQQQNSALGGFGAITADGVKVVQGKALAPVDITLPPDHGDGAFTIVSASAAPNAPSLEFNKLLAEIDLSDASPFEKGEAKSLLVRVAGNSLLQAVLASARSRSIN